MTPWDRTVPTPFARYWLVAALALVIVPHLGRLPAWLALLAVMVMAWQLLRDRYGWEYPGKAIRITLVIIAFGGVLLTNQHLFSRNAGVALLTVMLSLKLLELRSLRDATVVVFLAFFLLASGFLYDQSPGSAAYMLGAVLLLTGALAALNQPDGSPVHLRRHLKFAGGLMVQAAPLMVLGFLLFPRFEGPLWHTLDEGGAGRTGLSGEMRIGEIGLLVESEEVAFRVQFHSPAPDPNRLYWRGPVLWHTDGRGWTQLTEFERRSLDAPPYQPIGDRVEYTLTLEPHDQKWLLALDLPAELPEKASATPGLTIEAEERVGKVRRYQLTSYIDYRILALRPLERELALRLPEGGNPKARALATQWRREAADDREIVDRAIALFANEPFYYSRMPPVLGERNPMDEFLFDTQRGFCEHYAGAFTFLMRAAGIPARVVTGYQGGERNELGDYLIVRQSHAHAWAEVWLGQSGWTRVDPTTAIPPDRIEAQFDLQRFRSTAPVLPRTGGELVGRGFNFFRQGVDALNHGWNQWVLGYNSSRQMQFLRQVGLAELGWYGIVLVGFAAGAIIVALVTLWLLRRPRAADPVARAWQEFCAKLARRGIPRQPGETATAFGERIAAARPELAPKVALITRLYNALRYGHAPRAAWQGRLRQMVREFRP